MDDRERLYRLAKANGLEPHSRTGVPKLQEMLLDAGIEFELVDTSPDPDLEIPRPGEPKSALEGADMPEVEKTPLERTQERLKEEKEAHAEIARHKREHGELVEVLVMNPKGVHIAKADLGLHDEIGVSIKKKFRERFGVVRSVAEGLAARGLVEII